MSTKGWQKPSGSMKRLLTGCMLLLLATAGTTGPAAASGERTAKAPVPELTPEKLATLDRRQPVFTYNPAGRQDPFRPFINFAQIERAIPPDPGRPLTPLEKYSLNQFQLVGIILTGEGYGYALVEDPERIGYTVRVGDLIGKQSGRVTEIADNRVVIEEPYLDIFNRRRVRTITLLLHEPEEESTLALTPSPRSGNGRSASSTPQIRNHPVSASPKP